MKVFRVTCGRLNFKSVLRVIALIWVQSGIFVLITKSSYYSDYGGSDQATQTTQVVEIREKIVEKLIYPDVEYR